MDPEIFAVMVLGLLFANLILEYFLLNLALIACATFFLLVGIKQKFFSRKEEQDGRTSLGV
jgi:hypothetical protein